MTFSNVCHLRTVAVRNLRKSVFSAYGFIFGRIHLIFGIKIAIETRKTFAEIDFQIFICAGEKALNCLKEFFYRISLINKRIMMLISI